MSQLDQTTEFFDALAKVLLRCTVIGFLLLLFWLGMFMLPGDFMFRVHGGTFELSRHEFDVIHYCGMGLTKMIVSCFFLTPWLAIRLAFRKRAGN